LPEDTSYQRAKRFDWKIFPVKREERRNHVSRDEAPSQSRKRFSRQLLPVKRHDQGHQLEREDTRDLQAGRSD
jgi:hypothetical protein